MVFGHFAGYALKAIRITEHGSVIPGQTLTRM